MQNIDLLPCEPDYKKAKSIQKGLWAVIAGLVIISIAAWVVAIRFFGWEAFFSFLGLQFILIAGIMYSCFYLVINKKTLMRYEIYVLDKADKRQSFAIKFFLSNFLKECDRLFIESQN